MVKNYNIGNIYIITSPSGKQYIGQCVEFLCNGKKWGYKNRFLQHVRDSDKGKDYCRLLNNAIRKYGKDNLKLEKLISCNISELDIMEGYYIEKYNTMTPNGYNLITSGSNSRQSEETKQIRRESMMGKNKGKIYPRRPRKRKEDSELPKYLRYYTDKSGKEGYRISHHPSLKDKSFVGKYIPLVEKLKLATEYLNSAETSVRFNE